MNTVTYLLTQFRTYILTYFLTYSHESHLLSFLLLTYLLNVPHACSHLRQTPMSTAATCPLLASRAALNWRHHRLIPIDILLLSHPPSLTTHIPDYISGFHGSTSSRPFATLHIDTRLVRNTLLYESLFCI